MSVHDLKAAEPPARNEILELLDELRKEVESGEMVSLIAIPIYTHRVFATKSAGSARAIEIIGHLEFAKSAFVRKIRDE